MRASDMIGGCSSQAVNLDLGPCDEQHAHTGSYSTVYLSTRQILDDVGRGTRYRERPE